MRYTILVAMLLLMASCKKQKFEICYPTENGTQCDTIDHYETINFLNFDTCYKYKLKDSSERIICGELKITKINE